MSKSILSIHYGKKLLNEFMENVHTAHVTDSYGITVTARHSGMGVAMSAQTPKPIYGLAVTFHGRVHSGWNYDTFLNQFNRLYHQALSEERRMRHAEQCYQVAQNTIGDSPSIELMELMAAVEEETGHETSYHKMTPDDAEFWIDWMRAWWLKEKEAKR
jgi:hypothetical protein